MTAPALISLSDASVSFGDRPALSGLNLVIRRGDRVALVGANGSGKTSLLRLLHGLLPASQGSRTLHGLAPEGTAPVAAMLFQRPFLMHLSARNNIALALWLRGVNKPERKQRTDAALQRVGLAAEGGLPARALSGGQQQRLALARAWALQPDILFLDEPTASLDPSAKREVESLISEFARDGVTLVMSSHNLGQVKRMCDRVLYLDAGRLVCDLPTDRFFNDDLPAEATQFLKGELPWA
ncbi:MAG: phosphate ABC transporter ATP-binding protein [Burkholderiales bacterium PBB6]|nr:MAG: phosphate ABC transporter ATP-binding protein [Burkholderiales bacterium PBB6]